MAQVRLSKTLNHLNATEASCKRYAIFVCGPHLENSIGDYGDMIIHLLSSAKNCNLSFDKFTVYNNNPLPSFAHIVTYYDGIFLTGSRFDAHSNDKWCVDLRSFIRSIYDYNLQQIKEKNKGKMIKMIGICFGHQIIAHALDGGECARNDQTIWELGIKKLLLTNAFKEQFNVDMDSLMILESHRDAIIKLPKEAVLLATSNKTKVEMYCIGDMVLGMQGHPEFDKEYVQMIVDVLKDEESTPKEEVKYALRSLKEYEPNNDIFRRLILDFVDK